MLCGVVGNEKFKNNFLVVGYFPLLKGIKLNLCTPDKTPLTIIEKLSPKFVVSVANA